MSGVLVPDEPCRPALRRAVLFTAAVLADHGRLDHNERTRVISSVDEFDIHDPGERLNGLCEALASSGEALPCIPGPRLLSRAANRAEEWLSLGIHPLFLTVPAGPDTTKPQKPRVFFTKGSRAILHMPAVAVLNSRKPRSVSPGDPWLIGVKRLVEYARDDRTAVVSSYGNLAYSIVSSLAKGSPLIVVCDRVLPFMAGEKERERFIYDYRDLFQWESTLFMSSFSPGAPAPRPVRSVERDALVAELASTLLVAEIRPGGNMEAILTKAKQRNVNILGVDICPKPPPSIGRISVLPVPAGLGNGNTASGQDTVHDSPGAACGALRPADNKAGSDVHTHEAEPENTVGVFDSGWRKRLGACVITSIEEVAGRGCLVHYTRSCPGPWPGQTMAEYCRSLIAGHGDAAHTAFDTLIRILREGLIRGSSRMIRGTVPVVSFTECLPPDLFPLIKWRTGLARWSFEPYGIAVEKEVLLKLGARRVVYGDEKVYESLPPEERYRFQLLGSAGKDWSGEREWRLRGNLDIKNIEREDMVVVVRTMREAASVEERFALAVIAADRLRGKDSDVNHR
ncbi:MAG: hypothetical protein V1792_11320 [Pseudomonadota bacterium]